MQPHYVVRHLQRVPATGEAGVTAPGRALDQPRVLGRDHADDADDAERDHGEDSRTHDDDESQSSVAAFHLLADQSNYALPHLTSARFLKVSLTGSDLKI